MCCGGSTSNLGGFHPADHEQATVSCWSLNLIPQSQSPICEGGAPQLIDANITAAVATARTLAASVTDGSMPPIGARGIDPVTSARIAPYQQLAANTDWAKAAKIGTRLARISHTALLILADFGDCRVI